MMFEGVIAPPQLAACTKSSAEAVDTAEGSGLVSWAEQAISSDNIVIAESILRIIYSFVFQRLDPRLVGSCLIVREPLALT
jgi:hypothetical protein